VSHTIISVQLTVSSDSNPHPVLDNSFPLHSLEGQEK
jgi:hypothetical protein